MEIAYSFYTNREVFHHSVFKFEDVAWARRNVSSLDSYSLTYIKDVI